MDAFQDFLNNEHNHLAFSNDPNPIVYVLIFDQSAAVKSSSLLKADNKLCFIIATVPSTCFILCPHDRKYCQDGWDLSNCIFLYICLNVHSISKLNNAWQVETVPGM